MDAQRGKVGARYRFKSGSELESWSFSLVYYTQ